MRRLLATLSLALVATPAIAGAAAPRTFKDLADQVAVLLNSATFVLIVAGIAVYFWGISTNILHFSEKGGEKARAYFLWGIIVLFVMVSIWGIINILQNTIFGSDRFAPAAGIQTGGQTPVPSFGE